MASSAGRSTGVPQAGHRSGMRNSRSAPVRLSGRGRTTWGITSPARITSTWSPMRMSFWAIRSSLCRVAALTVTPEISTGASTAQGFSAPVRPTLIRMSSTRVTATSGANFRAMAQRGSRPPDHPQLAVEIEAVDLDHHAVGLEGQTAGSSSSKPAIASCTSARVVEPPAVRLHLEAPGGELVEQLPVGARRQPALDRLHGEGEHPEPAPAGEVGVELPEAAGGGVARVGEQRLARRARAPG